MGNLDLDGRGIPEVGSVSATVAGVVTIPISRVSLADDVIRRLAEDVIRSVLLGEEAVGGDELYMRDSSVTQSTLCYRLIDRERMKAAGVRIFIDLLINMFSLDPYNNKNQYSALRLFSVDPGLYFITNNRRMVIDELRFRCLFFLFIHK